MPALRDVPGIRRARHHLRIRASEHPVPYLQVARRKYPGPSPQVIGPDTEMVLDGYTRSASTFAVYALQLAQERPVRLAHHLHAAAQVVAGVRAGLPTLMVIREPRGAVLSQVLREPGVAIRDALVAYVRFHETVRPYRDGMVIGEFETVTRDFGSVVRQVNSRFGLDLKEFDSTPAATDECLGMIAQRGRYDQRLLGFESGLVSRDEARAAVRELTRVAGGETLREAWIPSAARRTAKDELAERWSHRRLDGLRARADDVYAELTAGQRLRAVTS
jgi:hypothetical protein